MAKGSGFHISGPVMGLLAIVAGVLVIWGALPLQWVIGVYLIIVGILAFMGK